MLVDIVIDTNVLGHAQNPSEPRFAASVAFLQALLESSTDICLDGIFAFGGANRSLMGQEYIDNIGFGSVSYVALTRLLESGRIRAISVKVKQDIKRYIETEIRNVRDRTFIRVTYNSEEMRLASHDRIDFPDDVRDRFRHRLGVLIRDASDFIPELQREEGGAEPAAEQGSAEPAAEQGSAEPPAEPGSAEPPAQVEQL